MKSLMLLLQVVLQDVGDWCCVSTARDYQTVACRVEHEGFAFLGITLPSFGSDFEKSLDQGKVDRNLFQGFKWKGGLPRFLGGFLDLVFDRGTGVLLDDPSIDAILAVRQVTRLFGKTLKPVSDLRTRAAMRRFVECEQEVRVSDSLLDSATAESFERIGNLLWYRVMYEMDLAIHHGELVPKHGSGATADRLRGNSKFTQSEWPARLERVFPARENVVPNDGVRHQERLNRVSILEPGQERPVRVIPVPKTLKTPRIIAIEPTCMQYMQQAIHERLVQEIEGDNIMSSVVGFRNQVPNQQAARAGSLYGNLATLDLSEASDRVSNQHVRLLTRRHGLFAQALDATRSRKADVLGFGVVRLAKFASMGSATTFPMEAMVFATVVFLGIERQLKTRLTRKHVQSLASQVRIYGDDIVVPAEYAESVVSALEDFGLRVNTGKSFWTGKFRESCGKEYYDGFDVSIVKVRRDIPSLPKRKLPTAHTREGRAARTEWTQEIVSTVSLMNQMYFAGLWKTTRMLEEHLERVCKIPLPEVLPTSTVLGKHSFSGHYANQKLCPDLHVPLVKGLVVKADLPESILDGSDALLKWFLKRGEEPFADKDHLAFAGRPESVDTKLRYASAV